MDILCVLLTGKIILHKIKSHWKGLLAVFIGVPNRIRPNTKQWSRWSTALDFEHKMFRTKQFTQAYEPKAAEACFLQRLNLSTVYQCLLFSNALLHSHTIYRRPFRNKYNISTPSPHRHPYNIFKECNKDQTKRFVTPHKFLIRVMHRMQDETNPREPV